jgi:N-acetylglutamate synthase-like GNAT family acetyltransferase
MHGWLRRFVAPWVTFAIHTVAVLPAFRGRHLANYIVSALLMRARVGGCLSATVLTNEHFGFFARHGFSLTPVDSLVRETQLS